jgi:hypothetical protein
MGSISMPAAVAVAAAGEGSVDVAAGAAATVAVDAGITGAAAAASADAIAAGGAAVVAGTVGSGAAAASSLGAAIGGGSIFTLGNASLAASAISGLGSAYEKHVQGVALSNDDKMKARQASLEAGAKQISLRQNMLRALASQNAMAGAGGIGTGGSFGANVGRQISESQNDLMALKSNGSAQTQQYNSQAGAASQAGNVGAGLSLFDTGANALKVGG